MTPLTLALSLRERELNQRFPNENDMKDSAVAREWLAASARTANAKDLVSHMDLISRKVQVFGIPGIEVIGYDDWAKQCQHEFETGVLKNVSYNGMKVQVMTPGRVMFKTIETVEANDGAVQAHGVEIILEKEIDGIWRVVQERILSREEAEHDGLWQ
jgi:ketosteroid isomerase-like protein